MSWVPADDDEVNDEGRGVAGRRRPVLLSVVGGLLLVLMVLLAEPVARMTGGGHADSRAVVDVTETLAAAGAALACAVRAAANWRAAANRRAVPQAAPVLGWALFAAACTSWTLGQLVWTVDELFRHRLTPTPALPDAGYLGFALITPLAMAAVCGARLRALARGRDVLDGMIIAGALFIVSWLLVLHDLVSAGGGRLSLTVSLAYPVADVVVLSVAVAAASRARLSSCVMLLIGGAALMAVSDSAFFYLNASRAFRTGGVTDGGWTSAFVLMAVAAVAGSANPSPEREREAALGDRMRPLLPYIPFVVALGFTSARSLTGPGDELAVTMTFLLVMLVLGRQGLLVLDNRRLLLQLQERSDALRAMAYTDPLTGISNRLAFTERLQELLGAGKDVTAAFCDLDSFKAVNDRCGHAVGDALLVTVARRLATAVRDGDVVARLGGDEFAVIAVDAGAGSLRERLEGALTPPFAQTPLIQAALAAGADGGAGAMLEVAPGGDGGAVVDAVTVSVGIVASTESGARDAEGLLHVADQRMYATKRARAASRAVSQAVVSAS